MRRKRLAVIGVGIVGTGPYGQGIPAMVNGLKKLTEKFSITIYSFISVDKTRVPEGIRVRCLHRKKRFLKVQFAWLRFRFILDHSIKPYNLIHAQSPYPAGAMAVWLNKFFNIPWLLSLHAGETIYLPEVPFGDLLNSHLKKAAFTICPKADLIMAMSKFQADITRENLNLEQEIFVLHRGVEAPALSEKVLTSPIRFLHISNYNPVKDYETLLKTFSQIIKKIPAELVIAGTNYDTKVSQLIDSLELNQKVKFVGAVPNEKLKELFTSSHILLHTSRYEGLPMTALEAMAYGVLVCGTNVGVMADFSGKYCLTVSPGDYIGLAKIVTDVVSDETVYNKLRADAHAFIKTRDLQWYADELEKLYSMVMA